MSIKGHTVDCDDISYQIFAEIYPNHNNSFSFDILIVFNHQYVRNEKYIDAVSEVIEDSLDNEIIGEDTFRVHNIERNKFSVAGKTYQLYFTYIKVEIEKEYEEDEKEKIQDNIKMIKNKLKKDLNHYVSLCDDIEKLENKINESNGR